MTRQHSSRRLGILASVLLISKTAFAADAGLDFVLAALAQRDHAHALFSEKIESPLFKRPVVTSGELFFDAPDHLEKRTTQPAPEDLLVDGDTATLVRGTHRSAMRLSDYPQLSPLLNGIRATLAGDRATLERYFQISFEESNPGWRLTLQPLPSDAKPLYKQIEIRGVAGSINSIVLERPSGERATMTLSEASEP